MMQVKYEFTLILADGTELTDDFAESLFVAGCDDASPSQSCGIVRMYFHREANSLQEAISSAIHQADATGVKVARVEMNRDELASAHKGAELAVQQIAQ